MSDSRFSQPNMLKILYEDNGHVKKEVEELKANHRLNAHRLAQTELRFQDIEARLRQIEADSARAKGAMVAYAAAASVVVGALTLLLQYLGKL